MKIYKNNFNQREYTEMVGSLGDNQHIHDCGDYYEIQDNPLPTAKELAEKELAEIQEWFDTNDWKVNKIVVGEWQATDERWTSYLAERSRKRARQDEINRTLNGGA